MRSAFMSGDSALLGPLLFSLCGLNEEGGGEVKKERKRVWPRGASLATCCISYSLSQISLDCAELRGEWEGSHAKRGKKREKGTVGRRFPSLPLATDYCYYSRARALGGKKKKRGGQGERGGGEGQRGRGSPLLSRPFAPRVRPEKKKKEGKGIGGEGGKREGAARLAAAQGQP